MNCSQCNFEMKKVDFVNSALYNCPSYIEVKKGLTTAPDRSSVSTYVCTICGKIEFIADNPQVFR